MKKLKILIATVTLSAGLASCSSAYYASTGYAADDLYAVHDKTEIARKKQAQAEAQRAAAEARKAEWEARMAEAQAAAAENSYYEYRSSDSNPYESVLADDYESAYARRLRGFESSSYKMPSSYINARYSTAFTYATAYDPAFYNIIISGDQVWAEPKYITSMFGSWGSTVYADPWYYGWNRPWGPSFSIGNWGWSFGWNAWNNPWYGPWGPYYSSWYNPWWGHGWGWGPGWHGHHHGPGWGPGWGHGGYGRPYQSNIVRRPRPFGSSGGGSTTYNRRPGTGNSWNSGVYQGGNRGNRRTNSGTYNPSNTRPNRTNTYNNPGWDNSNRNQNSGRRSSSSGSSSYTPSYSAPASSSGGYSGGGGGGGSRSGGSTGSSSRGR